MDTRTKIVQSFDRQGLKTIVGYFDPVHAGHIRRFRELCGPGERICVVVADPAEPILPTQARAELIAALEFVDAVIPAGPDADRVITGISNLIDERQQDVVRGQSFADHVLARHKSE